MTLLDGALSGHKSLKTGIETRRSAIYVKKLVDLRATVILCNLFFSLHTIGNGGTEIEGLNQEINQF
jgi:hypothetical protein